MAWYRMDLHLHTPASADYRDLSATYLQILQATEACGLDIIAITDHNSVSGIAAMRREMEDLQLLEELSRLTAAEQDILSEYRRLLAQLLILPGFEFTAAYGFHILAVFPPETSIRRLEYLLLTLGVREDELDAGSETVSEPADVLTAYDVIAEHGGLVIPAHADAAHGVLVDGAQYGSKTVAAYTQSPRIHALEVTDLDDLTRRGTAALFNGSRPEYQRRLHRIQGSDAHRISRGDGVREAGPVIGERATEALLPERSFAALEALFTSEDFARTRPWRSLPSASTDPIQAAREIGPTIEQSFHEQVRSRRSRYRPILKDVVAFANTNGGAIYVGASASAAQPVLGVQEPEEAARGLREAITRSVVPHLDVAIEATASGGKPVLVVAIPKGVNTPYATDAGQVFVRQSSESVVALRDEIVALVREAAIGSGDTPAAITFDRAWTAPRRAADDDEDREESEDIPEVAAAQDGNETGEPPAEARRQPRRRSRRRPSHAESEPAPPIDAASEHGGSAPALPDAEQVSVSGASEPVPQMAAPITLTAEDVTASSDVATVTEPAPEREDAPAPPAETGPAAPARTRPPRTRPPRRRPAADAETVPAPSDQEIIAAPDAVTASPLLPPPPTTGVEILTVEEHDGRKQYTMRDMRSGRIASDVTRGAARRLWRQAILAYESNPPSPEAVTWSGNVGMLGSTDGDGERRYNLALRQDEDVRYFYAVSDAGLAEPWRALITQQM